MDLIGRMRENIKREELLCKGDRVLIGFSGGPDSLCLFHLLKRLKKEVGFTMTNELHGGQLCQRKWS